MDVQNIKSQIRDLTKEHREDDYFESIEASCEDLIIMYCEENGYQINGFPHDKTEPEDAEEDYFSYDRYRKYLYTLTITKDDVGELMWFYVNSIWPEWFKNKQEMIEDFKNIINESPYKDLDF